MRCSANYEIVEHYVDRIVLRDFGPWDKFMTITNAAEDVIDDLFESGELKTGQRVFYFDSDGEFCELLVSNGKFAGFKEAGQ